MNDIVTGPDGASPSHPVAAVVGQLARDLVLTLSDLPSGGEAGAADDRREQLGGKGANQAVGLSQLGIPPQLVAVAGDDAVGDVLIEQARRDGLGTSAVVRRAGSRTGLIVELLDEKGWRYVQHLPPQVLLTAADVAAAESVIAGSDAVLVQLQQPAEAVLAAARIGRDADRLVVLDGAPERAIREDLLGLADVLRADEHEGELLCGGLVDASAARSLLDRGPSLVALGVPDGNLFVWPGGELFLPLTDDHVVDTTGGGDAFTAALTTALLLGEDPPTVATWAVAASGQTVRHVGGRPDLNRNDLRARAEQLRP